MGDRTVPASGFDAAAIPAPMPVSVTVTPSSTPSGFGDEDFISLKFDDQHTDTVHATATASTSRGTKRKSMGSGDEVDEETTTSAPVSEGAYKAPWAPGPYLQSNFTLRLHEELLDFCSYVAPKPDEQLMREELIARLTGLAHEAFPNAPSLQLKPFGSYATNLYLPISDIDLVLTGVDPHHATNPTMDKGKNSALGMLEKTMRQKGNASYLEYISKARIPILKLTDKLTGVKIDICYEIEGGLKAAEFILQKQQQLAALRPITLFLKYFLHCRILNDTYKGGIGSFMLQLMLINHLQDLDARQRLNTPSTNLGMILMSFLECFGISLNYKNAGLLISHPAPVGNTSSRQHMSTSFFNKEKKGWFNAGRPYLLSIENPLDSSHDVGSNSYLILRVRRALQFAYQTLAAHIFYESQSASDDKKHNRKRQKFDTNPSSSNLPSSSSSDRPFAAASHVPHTLLSHIVSVNEDLRPGQEEVDFEEMEAELRREETAQANRKRNVHIIESSSDDEDDIKITQPTFGEVDLVASSSEDSDDDLDGAFEDGEVDSNGEMSKFEKRFQVDRDDDSSDEDESEKPLSSPSESPSDDDEVHDNDIEEDQGNDDHHGQVMDDDHDVDVDDDQSSDDEENDDDDEDDSDDEGDDMDIDVDDAAYDDGEMFTPSNFNRHVTKSRRSNSSQRFSSNSHNGSHSPFGMDEDFIPLNNGGNANFPRAGRNNNPPPSSSRKKKGRSYDFSHTPHPSSHHSKKAKRKGKSQLRGHRTDGTKPNNQIFESNRSIKRKESKKKQHRQKQRQSR